MKTVMMKKAKLTLIDDLGNKITDMTIDLNGCTTLEFVHVEGSSFIMANGMRKPARILQTREQIDKLYSLPAKPYKVRSTSQIVIEGNNDF